MKVIDSTLFYCKKHALNDWNVLTTDDDFIMSEAFKSIAQAERVRLSMRANWKR